MAELRVLVVEDDPIAADAHAEYVRPLEGFALAGVARTGAEAMTFLSPGGRGAGEARLADPPLPASPAGVDLILLDMNLPDAHGLDVIRRIRGLGLPTDVIAITAVRDLQVVRSAISSGIVQYLIKPFTFSAFSDKLTSYQGFRRNLTGQASSTTQSEVDHAFAALRPAAFQGALPKGLSEETLRTVIRHLKLLPEPTSALEIADSLALSRVTARRYLEYLAEQESVRRTPRYGTRGRPEFEYSWAR
ncbi:response regulator [Arthrobacter sp. Br18]|uniref:response regulator n=1 Tax=Arthrobacter sp. Br18 TaxID=1312954 RepID=UPI00047E1136|nr:response regulator [Arthrobacter sp. Br18]